MTDSDPTKHPCDHRPGEEDGDLVCAICGDVIISVERDPNAPPKRKPYIRIAAIDDALSNDHKPRLREALTLAREEIRTLLNERDQYATRTMLAHQARDGLTEEIAMLPPARDVPAFPGWEVSR